MNVDTAFAGGALLVAVVTALGTLFHGWRRRIQDAARKPFLVGQAAVEEAETALRLKDRRLSELTAHEAELTQQLAAAQGTAKALGEQQMQLQARLYQVEAENRDLAARAETAESVGREQRTRIGALEETVEDLKRKLALGGNTY